jgi:hypothetical protein
VIARSPTEGARRPYVRRPHSPPVAARSLVLCAFPRDAFVRCWHVRGSPAFSFVVRRPRGACGWIHGVRVGNFRFIPLGNTYTGNCLIFLVEVGMQFWSCDALVYVVVCRCVRFGICSGAAPAGFGIDHPVSGGRRLAGHYPFCVSLSVRAVTCTRRVACSFSSALRVCALSVWGDVGVRACVRAAFSRASCLRRVRACAAWRPFSFVAWRRSRARCVAPFPQRLVVSSFYWRSTFVGYAFGSSLGLVTSFGASFPVCACSVGPR